MLCTQQTPAFPRMRRWNGYITYQTSGAGSWGEPADSCNPTLYTNGGNGGFIIITATAATWRSDYYTLGSTYPQCTARNLFPAATCPVSPLRKGSIHHLTNHEGQHIQLAAGIAAAACRLWRSVKISLPWEELLHAHIKGQSRRSCCGAQVYQLCGPHTRAHVSRPTARWAAPTRAAPSTAAPTATDERRKLRSKFCSQGDLIAEGPPGVLCR